MSPPVCLEMPRGILHTFSNFTQNNHRFYVFRTCIVKHFHYSKMVKGSDDPMKSKHPAFGELSSMLVVSVYIEDRV